MYRNCIFCTADLGSNDVVEHFPVGARVAFDAWRGRLWAVCPRCKRWNLAPIEERWEAVEEAERKFADARQRVQSENIGLARMPDGSRLVRVGDALPGELAVWRYGNELVRRRNRYFLMAGGAAALTVAAIASPVVALGGAGGMYQLFFNIPRAYMRRRTANQLLYAGPVPGRRSVVEIRHRHMQDAVLSESDGQLVLKIPTPFDAETAMPWLRGRAPCGPEIEFVGETAHRVVSRSIVHFNDKGASREKVTEAIGLLEHAGSAEDYIRRAARRAVLLSKSSNPLSITGTTVMNDVTGLALEMALHDESERRAMEGELSALEEAWREAETIAHIADALPYDLEQQVHRGDE